MTERADYTIQDYQRLSDLAFRYQAGDQASAEAIIEAFAWFIHKYINLISNEVFNIEDNTSRYFVGLFMKSEKHKKRINSYRYLYSVRDELYETIKKITHLFSRYSVDEIRSEMVYTLLYMASKYKDHEKPSFHNFVDKCFHKILFKNLKKLITDPITKTYIRFGDEDFLDTNTEVVFERVDNYASRQWELSHLYKNEGIRVKIKAISSDPYSDKVFDFNWQQGYDCNDVFKSLTVFERQLLKMHYIEKMTDSQIGMQCGSCRATINRKRLKAINKLTEKCQWMHLIQSDK